MCTICIFRLFLAHIPSQALVINIRDHTVDANKISPLTRSRDIQVRRDSFSDLTSSTIHGL